MARRHARMLVWVGGMPRTMLPQVADLAKDRNASLTFVEIINESEMIVRPVFGHGWTVPTRARHEALRRLEHASAEAQQAGIEVTTRLLVGPPVQSLVREIARRGYDLVVAVAPARRRRRSLFARLARESPQPVLLLHAGSRVRRPRVLVAIDISRRGAPRRTALIGKLLEHARWFAGPTGRVHVLHVWDAYGTGFMRRGGASDAKIKRYVGEVQRQRRLELRKAIAPLRRSVPRAVLHLERGDPRDVIPAFTRARRFDLVVVGTVARGGLVRWIVGNTAEALLGTLQCSLLVVRP